MKKEARYNLRLDEQLKEEMKTYSDKMGISTSKFIRHAIREYIKTHKP